MKIIHFDCGCHISDAAQQLVVACETEETAQGTFNDITLTAHKTSTVEGIVADFNTKMAAASEAYRNSPEGRRAAREAEERKQQAQQKHDTLMRQLPNLNFADDVAVLDWLCEFQDPSCFGVGKQQGAVLATFAAHGYYPGVNCGKDFNGDDRDNFARWVIGQALNTLSEFGAIHPIVHKFTDDWKKKFLPAAT